jgi:hypothetical protein
MNDYRTPLIFLGLGVASLARAQAPATAGSSHGATSGAGAGAGAGKSDSSYELLNLHYGWLLLGAFAAASALLFLWKTSIRINDYVRRLVNLNNDKQRFFVQADSRLAWFKEHLEYAPLFRTRHNREFQLSRAVNMGVLPSRLQSLGLAALIALNVTLCVIEIPFNQSEATAGEILRNRSGAMATVNLIPLVILAGRNNPLIPLLGISFDTWNFYHRALARIVVLESICHTVAWIVPKVDLSKCINPRNHDILALITFHHNQVVVGQLW